MPKPNFLEPKKSPSAFTHKKFCQKFTTGSPNFLYLDDCRRSGFGFGQINPVNRFNNMAWNSIGHYLHSLHILGNTAEAIIHGLKRMERLIQSNHIALTHQT